MPPFSTDSDLDNYLTSQTLSSFQSTTLTTTPQQVTDLSTVSAASPVLNTLPDTVTSPSYNLASPALNTLPDTVTDYSSLSVVPPTTSVPNLSTTIGSVPLTTSSTTSVDLRARLKAPTGQETAIYGAQGSTNLLNILYNTGGILFPYTPSISHSQEVGYRNTELVHTNGDIMIYNNTPSVTISIAAKFTAQNQREAQYLAAVMHFFKVVSKMHFGALDPNAGTPPPPLIFNAYGSYMYNNLRVLVKSHSYTLDDNVDYMKVSFAGGVAKVPVLMTMNIVLIQQNTPQEMRQVFNLEAFRTGALLRNGGGWI